MFKMMKACHPCTQVLEDFTFLCENDRHKKAILHENRCCVIQLMRYNADCNLEAGNGETPLTLATDRKLGDIVRILQCPR